MKKIILLCILLLNIIDVNASTYYGDYGSFSDYSENKIDSSDTIYVEEEKKTVYLEEKKIYSSYKSKEEVDLEYPYFEETDFIDSDIEIWSSEKPTLEAVIKERENYTYDVLAPIRYLHIYDGKASEGLFGIRRMQIKQNGYVIFETTCEQENCVYITLSPYGIGTIDLGDFYYIHELEIDISFTSLKQSFKMKFTSLEDFDSEIYASLESNVTGLGHTYQAIELTRVKKESVELKSFNKLEDNQFVKTISILKEYCYKPKLYRRFKVEKTYTELPTTGSIPQEITVYRFKKREKLVVKDDLIIKNKEDKLDDFILENSSKVDITSNVDYDKNGKYNILFRVNDLEVQREIVVDIIENENKKVEELEKDMIKKEEEEQKLLEEIHNLNYLVHEKDIQLKEIILEKNKIEKELNDRYQVMENLYDTLRKNKTNLDKTYIEKNSIIDKKILMICGIILLLSIIIRRMEKKKD